MTSPSAQKTAFTQLKGGTLYSANRGGARGDATSSFTSTGPNGASDAPTGSDMIALRKKGTQTLTFSTAVDGIYLAFVSVNRNTLQFDRDFEVLSSGGQDIDGARTDACGYWGCGTATRTENPETGTTDLSGTVEPHGTLYFGGHVTSLSWTSTNSAYWNGFTVGARTLAAAPSSPAPSDPGASDAAPERAGPAPARIPLPASGLLLAAALSVLALRHRIRA